jgi:hypothetical protein
MASREVSVVINGEEYVSKAADDAGKGMDKFTGGIKGWFRSFVDLKAAWDMASGAARFLYNQVVDSFRALDEYRGAIARLDAAAKITGVSITDLEAQVQQAKTTFQLGSTSAVDLTVATNKFAKAAGDTSLASRLMAAALDLGAAQGLKATQMAEGLTSALAGNDEFLNKLGLANPSQLWKDYAQAVGLSASKLTEQQQKFAVLNAIMEAGNKVTGTYSSYLETSAGKQDLLNNALEEARVSFGRALDPLRLMSIELGQKLMPVLNTLAPFIAKVVILTFTGFAKVLNNVYGLVGTLASGLGIMTSNNALAVWGAKSAQSAAQFGAALNELSDAAHNLGRTTETAADEQRKIDAAFARSQQLAGTYGTEVKNANEKVGTSSKAAADQVTGDSARINELLNRNLGPGLKDAIKLTEGALKDLGESARTQLDPAQAERFARHMQTLVTAAGDVRTRIEAIPEPVERSNRTAQNMARRMGDIARSGLDLAAAFGVVSDNAATTLNTVINIGVNLARVIGSKGKDGLAELFSSIAALLVRMMGGENDRRRLIENNTEALRSLRDEVGNLNLDVTGEDFGKIQKALSGVLPLLAGGRGAKNQADIFNALRRVGLSFADVKKLADQLGVAVTTSSGAISVEGIRALLEAMGMVELGQFGQSFAEQMRALRAGFDISGADSRQQLLGLLNLGQRFTGESLSGIFGRGLTDLASTRSGLVGLFERMQAGGITAAELGGLTGNQFLELITDLIRRIDDLAALPDTSPLTTPSTTAEVVTATQTVQAAVTAQTDAVTSALTAHGTLHTRVALATERTATAAEAILVEIRRAVTANTVAETVDQNLETTRRALAAQRGVQLSLG